MKIATALLLLCLGCKYLDKDTVIMTSQKGSSNNVNNKNAIQNGVKLDLKVNQKSPVNTDYEKLTCDSLLILLIKSSSIDKLTLSERAGIDSIKRGVIFLTFSHINKENGTWHNSYYLDADLNKRELRQVTEKSESLSFDRQLLNIIIDKQCYNNDVDYVTAP